MLYLKADTSVKVIIGPVVAVGDGFTPVTTLSLSTADEAELMKHDAAGVTDISGNTFAAITSMDGYYNLTITAAQLDTEGMLTVGINDDSLCLPVKADFMVVSANVYDSLFAASGTDVLDVNTTQVGGTSQTAGDIPALVTTVDTVVDGIQADLDNGTDGLGAIKAETALIVADTSELQTDWTNAGRLDAILDIIAADVVNLDGAAMRGTDSAALASVCTEARLSELDEATAGKMANQVDIIQTDTTTDIPASIAALNDISAADVNAQVVDVLETDTHAESAAVPAATSSLKDAIVWLKTLARNKITQTATTQTLRNDADSADLATSTVSDDGTTATRGEWS